jgi:hypothetical protein
MVAIADTGHSPGELGPDGDLAHRAAVAYQNRVEGAHEKAEHDEAGAAEGPAPGVGGRGRQAEPETARVGAHGDRPVGGAAAGARVAPVPD